MKAAILWFWGHGTCNGAWESLSGKPRMKWLELLDGGGGDLIVRIGRLRQHFLSS